jgi:hypothetical protein
MGGLLEVTVRELLRHQYAVVDLALERFSFW